MNGYRPQFILRQAWALTGLRGRLLERGYHLSPARTGSGRRDIYDTFDWRLFNKRLLLAHDSEDGAVLSLVDLADAGVISLNDTAAVARFSHEIESDALCSRLAPVIEERALICRGSYALRLEQRDISDKHGKIIARLHVEVLTGDQANGRKNARPLRVVSLHALRGYERKTGKIFSVIADYCNGEGSPVEVLSNYYTALGRTPGDYSSKMNVQLDRDMTIRRALSAILLSQLDMMESNIPGVRDDIDTEFLHDFRIANRRSRSLISGLKDALPAPVRDLGREFFSWLSKQTSTLRDIDVFLLAFRQYRQLLPAETYEQLMPLQSFLQQRRETERTDLLGALDSVRFHDYLRDWREALEEDYLHNWREALEEKTRDETGTERVVVDAAAEAIWKSWKRMRKHGRQAAGAKSDEALHELRISGKKLRYLLEAFRTLYPARDVERAIRQLRKLQNVLGDIVDYQVQQEYLSHWQENFPGRRQRDVKAAMDYLGRIYAKQEKATKKMFQRHFDAFVSAGNRELFRSLCNRTGS